MDPTTPHFNPMLTMCTRIEARQPTVTATDAHGVEVVSEIAMEPISQQTDHSELDGSAVG